MISSPTMKPDRLVGELLSLLMGGSITRGDLAK